MRRFVKRIVCFSGGLMAAGILLFVLPIERKFVYRFVQGDCYTHGAWIWQRMAENPAPVDVAFIGSSRTIHAVWEKAAEDSLAAQLLPKRHLLNLGYCRLGDNLAYLIARDLFQHKKPAVLIWEIRETEEQYSHPVFGYLAESGDVLWPAAGPHRRMLTDVWNAAAVRLEYQRARLFDSRLWAMHVDSSQFGYGADPSTADPEKLLEAKNKTHIAEPPEDVPAFPGVYLDKTLDLARQNDTRVIFLYLPAYGAFHNQPAHLDWYQKRGSVWLPPKKVLDDPANWLDHAHLNDRGAAQMAGWLARAL